MTKNDMTQFVYIHNKIQKNVMNSSWHIIVKHF